MTTFVFLEGISGNSGKPQRFDTVIESTSIYLRKSGRFGPIERNLLARNLNGQILP